MITTLFNKRLKQIAVLATLISIVSSAQAAVALVSLVSNIGNPMDEETYFHTSSPVYQSFTTGSSGANIYEISK
jgi:hypothetical protein